MLLQIEGYHLPGPVWQTGDEYYDNVHVGIQVGKRPHDLVRGDVGSASWSLPIEVVTVDGGLDFRGAAVQGRRGDRFVYLTWGTVDADGSFVMFRRAKLVLADLEPLITDAAATRVIARVDLTDDHGGPRCARLKPPALTLHRDN
ncbi:hypothetical protein A5724_15550 [Mycobacterium sp. ACS1612]|uniref:DUF5990 family protein n=1 Tax=Mycobacterium sp. ACS1612 TaxID=1834117 RepID=UPI0007FD1BD8|nr:DUF5990 family protein [Mycobacterium sp. ACS1612]OBF35593.1 hypothetical protein A5724_15550 [Mycobacterium sp. ACS1612]